MSDPTNTIAIRRIDLVDGARVRVAIDMDHDSIILYLHPETARTLRHALAVAPDYKLSDEPTEPA